jgi:hypothetical protein
MFAATLSRRTSQVQLHEVGPPIGVKSSVLSHDKFDMHVGA